MHVNNMSFEKEKFSRVLSHDLYWENRETYKLKRSIPDRKMFHNVGINLPVQSLGLQRLCADGRKIRPCRVCVKKKSVRSHLVGVTDRFSAVLEKRCFPSSVNVNN